MKPILLSLAILSCAGTITGCVSTQFTPITEAENRDDVSVLYDYPSKPYRKLGLMDLNYYRPGWSPPTVTDAVPKLKVKTREAGGNAFVIRGQRPGEIAARSIIVSIEVLKVEW